MPYELIAIITGTIISIAIYIRSLYEIKHLDSDWGVIGSLVGSIFIGMAFTAFIILMIKVDSIFFIVVSSLLIPLYIITVLTHWYLSDRFRLFNSEWFTANEDSKCK
jgi:hypothetical protein